MWTKLCDKLVKDDKAPLEHLLKIMRNKPVSRNWLLHFRRNFRKFIKSGVSTRFILLIFVRKSFIFNTINNIEKTSRSIKD